VDLGRDRRIPFSNVNAPRERVYCALIDADQVGTLENAR